MCFKLWSNPVGTCHMNAKQARGYKFQKNHCWERETAKKCKLKHETVVVATIKVSILWTGQKEHNPTVNGQNWVQLHELIVSLPGGNDEKQIFIWGGQKGNCAPPCSHGEQQAPAHNPWHCHSSLVELVIGHEVILHMRWLSRKLSDHSPHQTVC
jgi:hypothetical protein